MPAFPSFIGGSHVSQSPLADQQRTINFYEERLQVEGGKTRSVLYPTPGVASVMTFADAPVRAHFFRAGRDFAVVGPTLYEIFSDYTTINRGTVAFTDSTPVTICANGDGGAQLFITSCDVGYCYDLLTNTLTTELASGATMGAMLDGYFIVLDEATSKFVISDLLDGTTWDPLQFAQRSIAPDPWKALIVTFREIWLLGEETSEVWVNAGTFPFPFVPHPSGLVPYGIVAPFSLTEVGGTLTWLARTANGEGQVVQAKGFTPQVISTHALEAAIKGYARDFTIADAVGETYEDEGHSFYILTFPAANHTWVFDLTTGIWAERLTWISEENRYVGWRPLYHAFAFGKHLIGDREAGTIYRMSTDLTSDVDGRPIRRLRRAPALWNGGEPIFVSAFELFLEPGLGLVSGQGSDPRVALRISRDGGKTFGSERTRSAGALGKYQTRVRWLRCGSGRDVVFEITVTDPVPWRISGASLELRGAA